MKIIKELQWSEIENLRLDMEGHFDECNILDAINKAHCYRVCLYTEDFKIILINSSIEDRDLPLSEYPAIGDVIDSIRKNPHFLEKTNNHRRLDGKTVKRYIDEFKQNGSKPKYFFLDDRHCHSDMNPGGLLYVRDGMHHLVAYGLAVNVDETAFPIIGYYATNDEYEKTSEVFKTSEV